MAAATSILQHSYGMGPRGPNPTVGAEPLRGSQQAASVPSGQPRPEGQHQKPFFYIQSSQPYLPLQWSVPMPVSYNPYYAYPGLGYGLPVMPHYQPNPYMEPPGFVVPHTHLHLMDYRRILNPQYYQAMAYHARRFRYQDHSAAREMTSSEVQTEPLAAVHRTSTLKSNECFSHNASGIPTTQMVSPALAKQKEIPSPELQDMTFNSTTNTPSKGSFVIETEEVRIECCTTPVGLQLLHAHKTAEMSHSFSQDVVQCNSNLQSSVLQDKQLHLFAENSNQALQVSPDVVFAGEPTIGKVPLLEDSENQTTPVTLAFNLRSQEADCDKAEEMGADKNLSMTAKNFHLEVVDLPFDPKHLDELRKIESTVWSTEEALTPSTESLIQNAPMKTHKEELTALAEATAPEMLMLREEVPPKEVIPRTEMLPLVENELEDVIPTVGRLGDEMALEVPYPVSGDTRMSAMTHTAEMACPPNLIDLENPAMKTNRNQLRRQSDVQDHHNTSFESLPAYLPSTSWFSNFENFYNCSKTPPAPKKQRRPLSDRGLDVPNRRRKLDLELKELPNVHKPKERYKPKGTVDRQSLSDHECWLSRNLNENLFSPYVSKIERFCSRCLTKRRISTSSGPGCDGRGLKRKAVPFQQWNDTLLPTCDECKSHTKRRLIRKSSNPDLFAAQHGHNAEGESSGNTSCHMGPKRKATVDNRKFTDPKKLLASKQNVNKCPVALYPKLREKNCVCNELHHQPVTRERLHHCPHGNTIQEMDENCAMPVSFQDKERIIDRMCLKHSWHSGKDKVFNQNLNRHDEL
ncbi:uncharacterized protein LOC121628509 [Melanotaenia boesemani]|uniref:uncharacterized protein LOC121628509 n=1 Tax=Melanotaenia boesemani TaxID=1250792 RepID=UPI001C04C50B|nr:uncharacterized protein LOC121628509 [Melanotaenia boesemani]XP_041823489.1 uncharacterized protein LOC121628509 [Melanotaenia boesemani]